MDGELRDPWLVAVWPGMGKVALGAGSYMVEKLEAKRVAELPSRDFFDVDKIEFRRGVVKRMRMPRSYFYVWKNPSDGRDLVIFVGEAQPGARRLELCHQLLDKAEELGVRRVFTFAAMATKSRPKAVPRVFVVVNQEQLLEEFVEDDVEILDEGQISGLNGVLLVAAAERGMEGFCLLGELPYVGIVVPNPRASHAILELFCRHFGLQLDLDEMASQADDVDRGLLELMSQMKRKARRRAEEAGEATEPEIEPTLEAEAQADEKHPEDHQRIQIEELFQAATSDRAKALELKDVLDRLGMFKEYEDRFLDLFTSGG